MFAFQVLASFDQVLNFTLDSHTWWISTSSLKRPVLAHRKELRCKTEIRYFVCYPAPCDQRAGQGLSHGMVKKSFGIVFWGMSQDLRPGVSRFSSCLHILVLTHINRC